MNTKNEYKDNVIIALSVALVVAVLCCAVMGVVLGIGGDISASTEVALAYVEDDYQGYDTLNLESISITLSEPIVFDFVADSSITSLDVSFYTVFDDFIAQYNSINDTEYTSSVSSGYGDFDRFVPICFVIEPYSMQYSAITTSSDFRYTLKQYNQPLTTSTSTFDIRVANSSYLYSSSTLTCFGAKLSIPIEWNSYYPGAGVLGRLSISKMRIYYIEPKKLYNYGYHGGYSDGTDYGYDVGYDDGLVQGEQNGYDLGFSRGESVGRIDGYQDGYDDGYLVGDRDGNQNGYNVGYSEGLDVGYNDGYFVGKNDGFSQGVEQAGDYTFFSLITSVFDAPLRVLVGQWVDTDNDGVVDELVGGFLNFYIPVLDINLAPLILSIFTLCIIFVVIRFVLARL